MSWFLFLLLVPLSYSQTEELDAIEVKATKDIERFTYSNSSKVDLDKEPTTLISPALIKTPGIISVQNGGPGGRVTFFIRGTESRHVSYTIDGLKINDTSNTDRQFDAAFLMSPFVKEMTIYKGPQAVLYGSDAFGGLVDIKTRKGDNAPETRLSINGGSFGTIDSSLSKDWGTKAHKGTLTATRFHTDGISRLNKKRYNGKERDSSDVTQLTSSSAHEWNGKIDTDFLVSCNHGKAEQDGFNTDNNYDYSRNDQFTVQQKTNLRTGEKTSLSLRNGFNRHQRSNVGLTSGREFFDGNLYQNELLSRTEIHNLGVIAGISNDHETAKARSMDKAFNLNSVFLQTAFEKELFKLHAGVRADQHSKYGSFYTGAAGLGFWKFALQYSQGYKAPSLYQLYGPDSFGAPVGNPDLNPETNHSWELSLQEKNDSYEGGITLFQNRLSSQFAYSFTQGYLNQGRYIAEGIELNGKVKTSKVVLSGSFTHQDFRKEESTILRRPYNFADAGVSFFPVESIELNVSERWFGSRKDFGAVGITKLNGYEVTDVSIRKIWERDDVALQLKNIFDREYEDIYGFSVMPRSLFVHYGHQFQ